MATKRKPESEESFGGRRMTREDAREITRDFLASEVERLRKDEPYAVNSIRILEQTLAEL